MIDAQTLKKIRFGRVPWGQITVGQALRIDYLLARRTTIVLEGKENVPAD